MTLPLPPLPAVRAFEAAARHGSFTKAAEELGMTQAAVSYQIKVLEERVGAPLFLRKPRQVTLTEVGQRLAPAFTEAFSLIGEAYAQARSGAEGVLCVSTILTFASSWLARNLGAFQVQHPSLAVRVDTSSRLIDFAREDVDVAIRSGSGDWPGLARHFLFKTEFSPMLSPKLAASIGGLKEPADLLRLPILDPGDPWWREWFAAVGVPTDALAARPRSSMGAQAYEANAAMAGHGVAILTAAMFPNELADGRLIQPFDLVANDGNSYWLVYPEARRNVPKIRAFRDWLLAAFAASLGPQGA
ncbi:LysR family glycine cleavage system transcriptional activator [Mesorhizobium soli]|uniref:LysR substrate-binding domain-containing protein n=1 Tax=Pseudaminobacter soli (ex Li et al. 2025) TaxID=1295366 RepID=UPI0024752011|nr:LysR substrate-binding domain-containing protein [Mesorhizobium soli]MDH6231187.1 LysR family glycine cleavage system transcriptional activator [Mesorhizobium soli]